MYVRIFMKILCRIPHRSPREMVHALSSWGDSLHPPNTKVFLQPWLLLSPRQTSVALGFRIPQGDSDS